MNKYDVDFRVWNDTVAQVTINSDQLRFLDWLIDTVLDGMWGQEGFAYEILYNRLNREDLTENAPS